MSDSTAPLELGPIVVGLKPNPPRAIIETAARMAQAFDCELVCAYVEINSALLEQDFSGMRVTRSLVPEIDEEMGSFATQISEEVIAALENSPISWSIRVLGGDPAAALTRLSDELGARMLVVGTRRHGPIHLVEEFFSGSVAKKLAMRQGRPVVLVPLATRAEAG